MPCNDGVDPGGSTVYVESGAQTSRLCGILTVLEKQGLLKGVLDMVDWKEVGVSRQSTEAFWNKHKMDDIVRRRQERLRREKEAKRKEAIAKLSLEDRKLLGF